MDSLAAYILSLGLSPLALFATSFGIVFFLGEPAVLSLAFLSAASAVLPLWQVMVIGYATSILGEGFWFLIARSPWADMIGKKHSESVTGSDFKRYIAKLERGNPLRLLFGVRFIAGLSIVVVVYLSRQGLSFKRFLLYCIIINAFWTPIFALIGYAAGEGYSLLLATFDDIRLAIEIGLCALIAAYVCYRVFGKKPWQG